MRNTNRIKGENTKKKVSEYNFKSFWKNTPEIRALTKNPYSRQHLEPQNFKSYTARIRAKEGNLLGLNEPAAVNNTDKRLLNRSKELNGLFGGRKSKKTRRTRSNKTKRNKRK